MATPIDSPEDVKRQQSPAAIKDASGQHILPTQHLPGVDFGSHLKGENEAQEPARGASQPSYFDDRPQPTHDVKPIGKSKTDLQHADQDDAVKKHLLRRMNTAPPEDARRPQAPPRSSTFMRAFDRRQPRAEQYQYQFDPMSSSDSDSSSSDDEGRPTRAPKPHPKRKTEGTAAERTAQQQTKQDAKQGRSYSRFRMRNEHFGSKGRVSKRDGRLNISVNETSNNGYLAKALGHTIKHHLDVPSGRARKQQQYLADHPELAADVQSIASSLHTNQDRPKLNVVILVIGSRGDIQPFLKIGKILKDDYGYRVRLATHPTFREFVEKETDLEFFSVGGDPSELMAFMVKNPGLVPNLQTIRDGEIPRRRAAMGEMFEGMWRACTNMSDDEKDSKNVKMIDQSFPFIADAIIANPPSMAHVHIAERLGIPLHIMFTFPYTPTQAFPHPLANIRPGKSNVDASYINFISYPMVEMMTWQGLGDIVNKFRVRTLKLEPVSSLWAPGALYRMKVPYTYMWSPSLVPKPTDWGAEIDISGFVFMELANTFDPPKELQEFLDAGEPPVYIGFGSIVIDDPDRLTKMIVEAVKIAGVRALVNKGWGGLGTTNDNTPDSIFMLGNTPHDWLFPRCKAVVHHGGAGTTAIGLKCAKPTMIVPFFGDQPFWAARVAEAKAGAHEVVPWRQLDAEKFAEGIKQCLTEEAQINVKKLADGIEKEGDGAANACKSFQRSLPLAGRVNMRCSILEDRVAKWTLRNSTLRLSALAAEVLLQQGKIKPSDLKLFRVYSWNDFDGPGEPVSGTVGAVTDSLYGIGAGVGMVPVRAAQHMKKRAEHERKKAAVRRRKEERIESKREKKAAKAGQAQADDKRPAAKRENTSATMGSALSADPTTPLAVEMARDIGDGFKRSGAALLTMPNDLHVALAQGFHNAPRLWGDVTVRKPIRITGFKSGCTAAGKEFVYGIYDAWTGLVTLPAGGFKDGASIPAKFVGLGTGVGKGIGGFVLKNVSAIISPPAYFGKGTIVYIKKKQEQDGPGSKRFIKRANLVQGQIEMRRERDSKQPEEVKQVEQRVLEGWDVYERIWASGHARFSPTGRNVVGKLKFGRERQRWADAGALENVETAKKALDATQRGEDLGEHFARRQRQAEIAEAPRASAMDQPEQDADDVLPNGRRAPKHSTEAATTPRSESTFVASDEEKEKEREREKDSHVADGISRHDLVLDKLASRRELSRVTTA